MSSMNVSRIRFRANRHNFVGLPRSWKLQPQGTSVMVFSVECVTSEVKAHFSWNGDLANDDSVLVSSHLASRLGFKDGDEVVIRQVHEVPKCSQVTLKPVSKGDWQILEMNVSRVENTLLDQIRVLWRDLVFPIWVQPSVCAYVRIASSRPLSCPVELHFSTEVHVIPEIEAPPPTLAPSGPASESAPSVFGALRQMLSNMSGIGPSKAEDASENELESPLIKKIAARLVGSAPNNPQTEMTFVTNRVKHNCRFVALARRLEPPTEVEVKKNRTPDPNAGIADKELNEVQLIQGSVLCSVRVRFNPWDDEDVALCPLPLRRRLGLEDCGRILLEVQPEKFSEITALTLHPVFNTRLAAESAESLRSELLTTLGEHETFISNGSCLQIGAVGYIAAVDKPGWLRANTSTTLSVVRGQDLAARITPYSSLLLPVSNLESILTPSGGAISEEVGGCTSVIEELQFHMARCLSLPSTAPRKRPLLVTASRGVGKSHVTCKVVTDFCQMEAIWTHTVQCAMLRGKRPETLQKDWGKLLDEAFFRAPSVLVFDDLDALCGQAVGPEGDAGHDGQYFVRNSRIFKDLVHRARGKKVCFIVTAESWNSLCGILTKTEGLHLFAEVSEIRPPSRDERLEIFKVLCHRRGICVENLPDFGRRTEGFVARDLATLADRVLLSKASQACLSEPVTMENVLPLLAGVTPISLRGLNVERGGGGEFGADNGILATPSESGVDAQPSALMAEQIWGAVGAMSEHKQLLRETFLWPTRYPELVAQCPIRPVSSLLLYGMPGTGKTLLASCVAREADLNFISVKGPELLSKYIGASEQAVRDVFLRARSAAPCVIFFDEFDSMAPRRGHDSTGVTDRCVNQLLTLLDGVETDAGGVAVLAATSRPDLIDPALLRPGRLDRSVECPMPPNADARLAILQALSTRLSVPLSAEGQDALRDVAEKTERFTGADLQALLFNAQLLALQGDEGAKRRRYLSAGAGDVNDVPATVSELQDKSTGGGVCEDEHRGLQELDIGQVAYASSLQQGFVQLTPEMIESLPESDRAELQWQLVSRAFGADDTNDTADGRHCSAERGLALTRHHFEEALKDTRPSLSVSEVNKFRQIYAQFRGEEPMRPPDQALLSEVRATLA